MIRHVVLMTFTDPADAPEAKSRLEALAAEIPEISTLEVGLDVVGSPVSAHLALTTTHASLETLRAYQGHPVHEAFGAWVRPRLSGRVVVDSEF
jgi:hypothetical protein